MHSNSVSSALRDNLIVFEKRGTKRVKSFKEAEKMRSDLLSLTPFFIYDFVFGVKSDCSKQ